MTITQSPFGRLVREMLDRTRTGVKHSRLLFAAKTALAVGLAWFIAPHMPGVVDEYPYYAPLGALASMYPTVMSSVRTGLQTLAGLAIGIALAASVILFAEPNLLTISLVVGIGVLISGASRLGAGGAYIPMAALFVLIIGGHDADAYSIGYLVQMAVGVAVGLAVNVFILPPLTFDTADAELTALRRMLSGQLDDIAEALHEEWPPKHEDWSKHSDALARTAIDVREAVNAADDSRRANPRARHRRHEIDRDFDHAAALEKITFHARDLTEVLTGVIWSTPVAAPLADDLLPPVRDAVRAVAAVLNTPDRGGSMTEAKKDAEHALKILFDAIRTSGTTGTSSFSPGAVVAMDLERILQAIPAETDR